MINLNNNKGLTLVALIITIIVSFILVGTILSIAFKDEGVISKAEEAADKNTLAQDEEKIKITWTGVYIEQSNVMIDKLLEKLGTGWKKEAGYIVSPNDNKFEVDSHGNVTVIE